MAIIYNFRASRDSLPIQCNTNSGGGVECGYDRKIQNSYISNFAYKTDTCSVPMIAFEERGVALDQTVGVLAQMRRESRRISRYTV